MLLGVCFGCGILCALRWGWVCNVFSKKCLEWCAMRIDCKGKLLKDG